MVCNISVQEHDDGEMIAKVDGVQIPADVCLRSKILQDLLLGSAGTTQIPVTMPAWSLWVEYCPNAGFSLHSELLVLQVAQFLYDEECVRTLSEQVARTLRCALREVCRESSSSAQAALTSLPGLGTLDTFTADTASALMPDVVHEFSAADGPDLFCVLEQLSLAEMVALPEHLREAALRAHSPQHCLQLTLADGPFGAVQKTTEQYSAASLQILKGFAPLLGRVRVQSLVLSTCGMQHEHVQTIVASCSALASVTHLDISCNPLEPQDIAALVTAVAGASSNLVSLVMQSLSFTAGLTMPLPAALSAPEYWLKVQKVDMRGCSLLGTDYSALLHCLASLQHLMHLDLSAVSVVDSDHSSNAHALDELQFSTLQHLGLSVDCAVHEVCAALVRQLPRSTSLTFLDLTGPSTGQVPLPCVDNAHQLMQAAACLPSLAVLTCTAMPVGSAVSEIVPEEGVPCTDSLPIQSLTVRNPDTYSPGLKTVYEMAVHGIPCHPWTQLRGLLHLCLEAPANFEFAGAVAEFLQALGCLTALKSFHLSDFRAVQLGATALSETLSAMKSLTALVLSGSCVVQVKSMHAPPKPNEHPNTAISELVTLERLCLSGPQCNEVPFGKVAWSLLKLTRLTHLEIAYGTSGSGFVQMSERIAFAIGSHLPALRALRLDLYNTHGYVQYLKPLTTLTALSLRVRCRLVMQDRRIVTRTGVSSGFADQSLGRVMGRSELDTGAAKSLADLFCVLVGLQHLCIDWVEVSDDDSVQLCRGLKALTGLQGLEISPVSENISQDVLNSLRDAPLTRGVRLIPST